MKKLLLVIALVSATALAANQFWFGKTMDPAKAEARWGHDEFRPQAFKAATPEARAKMAASAVRNKRLWIGKSLPEVRQELGSHDGYYFTDSIPAYLVQIAETAADETWQVVFLPDNKNRVKDVIIHRNY